MKGYEDTFGKVEAQKEGDKTENKSDASKGDGDDTDHRTGGIFGGAEGGFASGPDKSDPNDKPGDMIKDMAKMQKDSGYF